MGEFNKISWGEVKQEVWLAEAIEDYIRENPLVDNDTIHSHFKMRVDIISSILTQLRVDKKIERIHLGSGKLIYKIK